jgi:hypothetical protein
MPIQKDEVADKYRASAIESLWDPQSDFEHDASKRCKEERVLTAEIWLAFEKSPEAVESILIDSERLNGPVPVTRQVPNFAY